MTGVRRFPGLHIVVDTLGLPHAIHMTRASVTDRSGTLEMVSLNLDSLSSIKKYLVKRKQDYGHQAVAVMLSCNGIVLNYAIVMYNKSKSKIDIVRDIARELPVPPVISYFLCDSWYTSAKGMDAFVKKGFYTVGTLKSNRVIYPCGIKQQISSFALHLRKIGSAVRLVTVGSRKYYVYRYEGPLNGLEDAVVLITYPKDAFLSTKALRAFVSMDASLSTRQIFDIYVERWPIKVEVVN